MMSWGVKEAARKAKKLRQARGRSYTAFLLAAVSPVALFGVTQAMAADQSQGSDVETVVVTGTLIPTGSTETISPVTQITSDQIRQQGQTRIEDVLNQLPQVYAGLQTSTPAGFSINSGISNVNLRNLGAQRTLVLVNGRRLMPGDPITGQAGDLNNIPSVLVDRVDVVTGGASATYGSDAVAGVVNFVLKDNLEGIRLDAQYSGYQNNNDNKQAQKALTAAGLSLPPSNVWDGGTMDLNMAAGVNTSDGKGNVTAYVGYRKSNPVNVESRDYTKCAFKSGASLQCSFNSVTDPGTFQALNSAGLVTGTYAIDHNTGNTFIPYDASYAYSGNGQLFNLQRPAARIIGGALMKYEISPHIELYGELMGMDNHGFMRQAPAGTFGQQFTVACNNPMLSAQQESILCGANPPTAVVPFKLSLLNDLAGYKIDDVRNDSYRMVGGVRGEVGDGWHYDIYAQSGTTLYTESQQNLFSTRKIQNAINVVQDGSGNLVCSVALSGVDPKCVPYNIFQAGALTPQAVQYVGVPDTTTGNTSEQVINATVTKDLSNYGIASPFAKDGASIAVGSQYRRESLNLRPDQEWQSGDLTGSGTVLPVSGSFNVYEFYGEMSAPLAQGVQWAENLSVNGGYRYSHYSSAGGTNTYKFGGEWSPISDVNLRSSYQHAVRAPSIVEMFSSQSRVLFSGTDPCSGAAPTATLAQCENSGVTPAQYGHIPAQNDIFPYSLAGGNPDLKPERSDTKSFGLTLTPSALPGFSLTVDYFNIGVSDVIGKVSSLLALTQCTATGNPTYCGLIHRAPGSGVLAGDPNGYVTATNVNLGSMSTSGIDFQATYAVDLGNVAGSNFGSADISLYGTYVGKYAVTPVEGLGSYDCSGLFGPTCGYPHSTWRHQARLNWNTPWDDFQLGLAWRHIGGVNLEKTSSNPLLKGVVQPTDARVSNVDYFDLSMMKPLSSDLTLRAGISNLFDRDPPQVGQGNGTAGDSTFPGLYDVMGRYLYVSVSANL